MEIIRENIASIRHNDESINSRVQLSIVYYPENWQYAIVTDSDDEPRYFKSIDDAEQAIHDLWGRSTEWDLQYK